MSIRDETINLCNDCGNSAHFPDCIPKNVQFGNGFGNDNIIACRNHSDVDTIQAWKDKYAEEVKNVNEKQNPFDPDTSEIPC